MDLMQLGSQLLASQLGNGVNADSINKALGGLLSDSNGKLDLGSLISAMQGQDLGAIAASWLGDGDNAGISTTQVREVVGKDKVAAMASELDSDEDSILNGLKEALPQLIDNSSKGGTLLDNPGDLLNLAKSLF
ncbi:MAG: YidB family protein [Gammaproteobacteria bacterium]|nr:YidB family protein [Gammaproteobacteria bacterium]